MHKLVVLYPRPIDPEAFITYYESTHLQLVARLPGILSWRYTTEVQPGPNGSPPAFFAVFEAEFATRDDFLAAMNSPQGQTVAADVPNYATGGATTIDYTVSEGSAP